MARVFCNDNSHRNSGDAPQIAALWNPLIVATLITFTSEKKTIIGLETVIQARGRAFQVIEEGGTIQGFATFFHFRAGPGYARTMEHSVILAPEAQGRGQGQKLMAALEAEARQSGVHSLWAGVSEENPAGVAQQCREGRPAVNAPRK